MAGFGSRITAPSSSATVFAVTNILQIQKI
jgi:hypothetical protein